MRFFYVALIFFCFLSVLQAQDCSLKGKVNDEGGGLLAGVLVIVRGNGGLSIAQETDSLGSFSFSNLPCESFTVEVSLIGYGEVKITTESTSNKDLGVIILKEEVALLKEVKVQGTAQRMEQKGDTTVYNSSAYKVNADATVEDLVKKMPGITVEGGQVKSQGENIQKVLIDGKEFFGEDAMMALKNLSSDMVESIQTFDRPSDRSRITGFDDGQQTRTMNIVTKSGMNKSTVGRVYAGYGTEERYLAGGVVNKFDGDKKITVLGMINNINQQNFSSNDVGGGGGQNRRMGPQRPNQGPGEFGVSDQNGIAKTYSLGFNYTNKFGEKLNFNLSNFLNFRDLEAVSVLEREFFTRDSTKQFYDEKSRSRNGGLSYRMNSRMELSIDSNNALIWTPKLSYQNTGLENSFDSKTIVGRDTLNRVNNNNPLGTYAFSAAQTLLYLHKFRKKGRTFSVSEELEYTENLNDLFIRADKRFFIPIDTSLTTDQRQLGKSSGLNNNLLLTLTEKVGESGIVSFNYSLITNLRRFERSNKNRQNPSDDHNLLDTLLSARLNSNIIRNGLSVAYNYKGQKLGIESELKYERIDFNNKHELPFTLTTNKTFHNLLPMFKATYSFSKNTNIRFRYRTSTDIPSAGQLQQAIDNQNTVLLSSGNPQLNQQYNHQFFIRFYSMNPETNRNFMFFHMTTHSDGYIGSENQLFRMDTTINQYLVRGGTQLVRSLNVNGYGMSRTYLNYSMPLKPIKSNLSLGASLSFTRTPSVINKATNLTTTVVPGVNVTISSNISEKIDFTVFTNGSQTWVENKLNPSRNSSFYTVSNAAKLNLYFTKNLYINIDLTNNNYIGLGEGFDQSINLWSMGLGYKFLKDKKGDLRLNVFDLLNQNNYVNRNVTDVYLENSSTNLLRRYVMLVFTYQIKQVKPKAKQEENKKE